MRRKKRRSSSIQDPERRSLRSARLKHSNFGGVSKLGGFRQFARQNGSSYRESNGFRGATARSGRATFGHSRNSRHQNNARDHAQISRGQRTEVKKITESTATRRDRHCRR